jgi:alpha-L-fucosidase
LWGRHLNPNPRDTSLDKAYNTYLIAQLKEVIKITRRYTPIVELWLDAGWEKARAHWPIAAICRLRSG